MIAGVPGAGISAFFYLVCVLLMPVVAVVRMLRGQPPRWPLVARQLAIGLGIVGGLVVGGSIVGAVALLSVPPAAQGEVGHAAMAIGLALGRVGALLGIATLVVVLGSVQLFTIIDRAVNRRGISRGNRPGRPAAPPDSA